MRSKILVIGIVFMLSVVHGWDFDTRAEPARIEFSAGMKLPLEIGAEYSGTREKPSVIEPMPGRRLVLNGGVAVDNWSASLGAAARGELGEVVARHVLVADLRGTQFEHIHQVPRGWGPARPESAFPELWFRGRRMQPARWPNAGFARIEALPNGGIAETFQLLKSIDNPRFTTGTWVWALGYWMHDWSSSYLPAQVIDAHKGILELKQPGSVYGLRTNARVKIFNSLSLLDEEGEWYFDDQRTMLYFWPPRSPAAGDVQLSAVVTLLRIDGARHLRLRGLDLSMARGTALIIENSEDITVEDCTLNGAGVSGAIIRNSINSGLRGCRFSNIGEEAVVLSGGERKTLTPGQNFVNNSDIQKYGLWQSVAAGVRVTGVGNVVSNTIFHAATGGGLLLEGNDHLIYRNRFFDLIHDVGDVGAIYTGRDWTARGTLISENLICGLSTQLAGGARGIYLDDLASGIAVINNSIVDVQYGIFIGGGSDNIIQSNWVVGGEVPLTLDARGLTWAREKVLDPNWDLVRRLKAMPYQGPPFAQRYPTLPGMLDAEPGMPKRNVIEGNMIFASKLGSFDPQVLDYQLIIRNRIGSEMEGREVIAHLPPECDPPASNERR